MKGRMMLFVASISACQFSPIHLTPSAADQVGVASVYSHESGSATASGEKLDHEAFTAAHRTLPFGTKVRVVSLRTGASVVVRINDRGPFGRSDRIIDLSRGAARRIGLDRAGVMRVRLEVVVPLGGSAPEPRERAPAE